MKSFPKGPPAQLAKPLCYRRTRRNESGPGYTEKELCCLPRIRIDSRRAINTDHYASLNRPSANQYDLLHQHAN